MAGIDVVKALHKEHVSTPVIMLTARHDELDKVAALEAGCDDYITKPFSIKELVARINAVMRRTASHTHEEDGGDRTISKGDLEIDLEKRTVMVRGEEIQLTATEFNLLTLLVRQPGRVYSRKQLLDIVWDYSFEGYENTVNTHVNRLRSKIEKNPNKPEYVLTVWGVGYKFSDELGD
jgi:DNA-binding response OmpR family regulator